MIRFGPIDNRRNEMVTWRTIFVPLDGFLDVCKVASMSVCRDFEKKCGAYSSRAANEASNLRAHRFLLLDLYATIDRFVTLMYNLLKTSTSAIASLRSALETRTDEEVSMAERGGKFSFKLIENGWIDGRCPELMPILSSWSISSVGNFGYIANSTYLLASQFK